MGAGRVVSTVAKVIAFPAFVVIGVLLFRKDSMTSLSDRWAMHKCPDFVQADLTTAIPYGAPKVVSCEGSPTQATCLVETTEKTGRKTAPVKNWDCTKRHLSPDSMEVFMGGGYQMLEEAPGSEKGRELIEQMQKNQRELVESVKYVRTRLEERSDVLGDQ